MSTYHNGKPVVVAYSPLMPNMNVNSNAPSGIPQPVMLYNSSSATGTWPLRALGAILLASSLLDIFRPIVAAAFELNSIGAFFSNYGLFSAIASCLILGGCTLRERGSLTAVQVLLVVECVLAVGRMIAAIVVVSVGYGPSGSFLVNVIADRVASLAVALTVMSLVVVAANKAKQEFTNI